MRPTFVLIVLASLTTLLLAAGNEKTSPDGRDLVGTRVPDLAFERWIGTDGGKPPETRGRAVLYRWWTGGCRYCEQSLPAIESLRKKYDPEKLLVVAVYHPKPVRKVSDEVVRSAAAGFGYGGAVAVDEDWSELKRLWLDAGARRATSVTVLVDVEGVIRHVHPGPALFPSDDPGDATENRAFEELDRAIGKLLETEG